jgi:hypothetical protein
MTPSALLLAVNQAPLAIQVCSTIGRPQISTVYRFCRTSLAESAAVSHSCVQTGPLPVTQTPSGGSSGDFFNLIHLYALLRDGLLESGRLCLAAAFTIRRYKAPRKPVGPEQFISRNVSTQAVRQSCTALDLRVRPSCTLTGRCRTKNYRCSYSVGNRRTIKKVFPRLPENR